MLCAYFKNNKEIMDERDFAIFLYNFGGIPFVVTATRAPLLVCISVLPSVIWGLDSPHKECCIHFAQLKQPEKDPSGISPTSILGTQNGSSLYTKHVGYQQYLFDIFTDSEFHFTESTSYYYHPVIFKMCRLSMYATRHIIFFNCVYHYVS